VASTRFRTVALISGGVAAVSALSANWLARD
jgi:hypothetical protein